MRRVAVWDKTLKPCPFCGGKAKIKHADYSNYSIYWVECTECRCELTASEKIGEAVERWNIRKG